MSYLKKYYIMAENELENRKARNRELQQEQIAKAEESVPRLRSLRNQLASGGAKLAAVLVSGGDMKKNVEKIAAENLSLQREIGELLLANGFKPSCLDPIYSCEKCQDTGIYNNERCSCFMNDVRRFQCMELNSSSAMNLCSFDTFDLNFYPEDTEGTSGVSIRRIMEDNYDFCRDYADKFCLPHLGILMNGGTGLGKTHLSLAVGKEVIEKGYSVIYGSAPDLLRKAEKEHFRGGDEMDIMQLLYECDLLIIDDLGAEFESKFNDSVIYNLLNTRMNAGRPVIVNTNFQTSELHKRYGDRIASRLFTMEILTFYGNDIRLMKKYAK
ncbi:MAG: ATP-binding protein [Oscillospiraceae bacterium]|nr:ATP-binding protein [Oscillospiraceae bacterium]